MMVDVIEPAAAVAATKKSIVDDTVGPIVFAHAPPTKQEKAATTHRQQQLGDKFLTVVHGLALSMGVLVDKRNFFQEWMTYDSVKCVVNYPLRRISLYFKFNQQDYKAEFEFKDMVNGEILADDLSINRARSSSGANKKGEEGESGARKAGKKKNKKQQPSKDKASQVLFFTFHLKYPPEYWRLTHRGSTMQQNQWARVAQIPVDAAGSDGDIVTSCEPLTVGADDDGAADQHQQLLPGDGRRIKYMQLGTWIVLRMSFSTNSPVRKAYDEVIQRGKNYRLVRELYPRRRLIPTTESATSQQRQSNRQVHEDMNDEKAAFSKYYVLHGYISRYQLNKHELDGLFYSEYAKLSPDNANSALQLMLNTMTMEHGHRKTPGQLLKQITDRYFNLKPKSSSQQQQQQPSAATPQDNEEADTGKQAMTTTTKKKKKNEEPPRLIKVNKITITPTTIRIERPQIEPPNRVLRQFIDKLDRFIRIQFADENGARVHISPKALHDSEAIYRRIAYVIQHGLIVFGRHYRFLAFSQSQLREHGCWFFADKDGASTADEIRKWMGDFSGDKVVAKYAARMGQCFSSTQAIQKLHTKQVDQVDDIEQNGFTFSDGVGLISVNLARTIAARSYQSAGKVAMANKHFLLPSAFQFRLGGAKGVLTVDSFNHLADGKDIALRPSQIKFTSTHKMLEINRPAHASFTYLNRQIILLLSSLGVPDDIFMELLQVMLGQFDKILADPIQCTLMLRSHHSDEFGIHMEMAKLVNAGFLEEGDPYITNLIKVFRSSKFKEAKKRAKIYVPQAASAIGVLDETKTLKPGQIFVQLSGGINDGEKNGSGGKSKKKNKKNKKNNKNILQGPCVVYRCPSLHPGDIRMVEAVDCPALHGLHDVIVFSAQGERDIPSMCSGGDLDGDIYSVIWDERLFPATKDTKPMHHMPVPMRQIQGRNVEIDDVKKFFLDYIINDNLGMIANAHMALADSSPDGACANECIELAYLHSVAVDFPKTGVIAELSDTLRAKWYPDFMEKIDKPVYKSTKILGKLYREVDAETFQYYKQDLHESFYLQKDGKKIMEMKYDTRLFVDGMQKYILAARELKEKYDQQLQELMDQFGVATESEIVSGSIVKWLKRMDGPEKFHETRHQAQLQVTRLRDDWRRAHFPTLKKEHGGYYTGEQKHQDMCKAAAWYYVTYHPTEFQNLKASAAAAVNEDSRLYQGYLDEDYGGGQQKKKNSRNKQQQAQRMLSFPWVAHEILCRLARVNPPLEEHARAIPELEILSLGGNDNRNRGSRSASDAIVTRSGNGRRRKSSRISSGSSSSGSSGGAINSAGGANASPSASSSSCASSSFAY
ncbi:RNA dependent RNA polymerase-domain-containing protein [Zychaea mexicana]|uniref:RNA dependent RNA polymerase-domain-containing protein n=1 Tax=Zychaea mexicana TaxID=64656 RepID=UPI0022FEACA1|nr:RNA dependent RNA polymerase-domain-containing protein [Zychaea mexicana]KAI9490301.1 RNA dependent RNA polymerase-domain-containing protein [Zychaea mexicana]